MADAAGCIVRDQEARAHQTVADLNGFPVGRGVVVQIIGVPGAGKTYAKRALCATGLFRIPAGDSSAESHPEESLEQVFGGLGRKLSADFERIIKAACPPHSHDRRMQEISHCLSRLSEISRGEYNYVLDEFFLQKLIGYLAKSNYPWRYVRDVWRILKSPLVPDRVVVVDCAYGDCLQRQIDRGRVIYRQKKTYQQYRTALSVVTTLLPWSGRKIVRFNSSTRSPAEIADSILAWLGETSSRNDRL